MSDESVTNIPHLDQVPPEVAGGHDADGTMGRMAGTGSGAIAGGLVGTAVAGAVGTVVGAVAGGLLGVAGGDAAHKVGDDHDDVNIRTDSDGTLGRDSGAGAGAISGGIIGSTAGPAGTVAGAVAGGMLGAAAGDAAKDIGGDNTNAGYATTNSYDRTGAVDTRSAAERAADAVTGDRIDDKTGNVVR